MKKKNLIVMSVLISGLAVVVANNVKVAFANDEKECITPVEYSSAKGKHYCCKHNKENTVCTFYVGDGRNSDMYHAYTEYFDY